jgi:hypothetical protein
MTYEYPHASRLVIIGDMHGDIKRFKKILEDAKIINDDLEWIAEPPDTVVVQLGDQIDSLNRMPNAGEWEILEDFNMLYFTNSLHNIASMKGGKVISLIGNHELMNVIGNFSYVSPKSNIPGRQEYFKPQGTLSGILGKRPLVLKIGELFFCHACVKKHHVELLATCNKDISYINQLWSEFMLNGKINIKDKDIFDKIILDMDGILWTRVFDSSDDLDYVLKELNCQYIFVGHSSVENIQLVNNKIWLTDTGISRAFGGNSFQYIDINNYNISVKKMTD